MVIDCIDIGGSFIRRGVMNSDGAMQVTGQLATPARSWDDLKGALSLLLGGPRSAPSPVAISVAGTIDPDSGVCTSANIPCLSGRALADSVSSLLNRRVIAANDALCFALAEATRGSGAGHRVVFGIILGTGIGGGLVVNGAIVQGAGGISGEWGHGPIVKTIAGNPPVVVPRLPCGCGRTGCVDTIGGARGIERLHQVLHGGYCSSRTIIGAWLAGEDAATRTLDVYLELVSEPLALCVNVTGAAILPAGGGLATVPSLISALDEAVRNRMLRATERPVVVPARHQADGGLIGAGLLARQELEA